jgi:hypothetical protein
MNWEFFVVAIPGGLITALFCNAFRPFLGKNRPFSIQWLAELV